MIHEIDVLRWLLGEDYASVEVRYGNKCRRAGENLQDPQVMIKWWKEFFSVLSMMGCHGDVSLEMEDLTMSVEAGVATSADALRQTISQ